MNRFARVVAGAVAVTLLSACGSTGNRGETGGFVSGDRSIITVDPDERREAPVLEGMDLDGKPLSSADFAGKTLVVNVWGSWCAPCRKEAPALKEVSEQYADKGVQFLGILVRDKPPAALAFNRKAGITYPSISDYSGKTTLGFADSLPSQAIPTTWVIDAKGRVAARVLADVSASTLAGLIDYVQKSAA